MITREQWKAETREIKAAAEALWKFSVKFEESTSSYVSDLDHARLMPIYEEMIVMAYDRDCEDEDYPTEAEIAEKRTLSELKDVHSNLGARAKELGLPTLAGGAS
jgi:hypothetical protein